VITIDGRPVHRAELHVPWSERWQIKVALDGTEALTGLVTIQWGATTLVGTVDDDESGTWQGETIATIVGGPGWAQEIPPVWQQSDSPGLSGLTVARQVAELVGETLAGPTTGAAVAASSFRPLRVSYACPRATAASVLQDCLAPGAGWWIDFDGATRVGARPAPPTPARVALLELQAAEGWATLDAADPSDVLVGSTLAADPTRGLPALRIVELWAWSGPDGERYRAHVAAAPPSGASRLASAFERLARAAAPELPSLAVRRARVTSQGSDGRVSLVQVDRAGDVPDVGRTEGAVRLYPGLAGTSAEVDTAASPEVVLAFSRADWSDPLAFLAAPLGQPGHVPVRVRHEASTEILMVTASAGKVLVGPLGAGEAARVPVAKAPPVEAIQAALEVFAGALAGAAPPGPTPAQVLAAATALQTALQAVLPIPTARLESA
jgi:hypothetical protein